MKRNLLFIYIAAVLGLILILYFSLFSYDPGSAGRGDSDDETGETVSMLLGSGGHRRGPEKENSGESSVFQSDFWEAGVNMKDEDFAEDEEDTGILDPVSKDNPVNPQTGKPYTDYMMKRFEKLRERFPGNNLIPRKVTPEEKMKEDYERRDMMRIQSRIAQKQAEPEDVNKYYDYQSKKIQDRLEILEYVLNNQKAGIPDAMREKYEKILEMNRKQLESYDKARENALNNLR